MANARLLLSGVRWKAAIKTTVWAILLGWTVAAAPAIQAQTFTLLHTFSGPDGASPSAGLSMDRAGNFYGTTLTGGEGQVGTVFKMTRRQVRMDLCHTVQLSRTRRQQSAGQSDHRSRWQSIRHDDEWGQRQPGYGFQITAARELLPSRSLSLDGNRGAFVSGGQRDGRNPTFGDLTFDQAGNIYGSTPYGGATTGCNGLGCGTVYKLTPSNGGWTESILYNCQPAEGRSAGTVWRRHLRRGRQSVRGVSGGRRRRRRRGLQVDSVSRRLDGERPLQLH